MAPRYSLPSSSVGINRFWAWPAGADSYDHTELTSNWDRLDGILGAPAGGGTWPPTTGLDGGIYKLIQLLQSERAPIGQVSHWFRPSLLVPLTTVTAAGWHIADGSTLTAGQHAFPGIAGSVTLPNLLNQFIVGADSSKTIGQAGTGVGSGTENSAAGAPGPQGAGGANSQVLSLAQMPTHDHSGATSAVGFDNQRVNDWNGIGVGVPVVLGLLLTNEQATHSHTIASAGGSNAMDNRPNYAGLIPIIKVRNISSI